MTYFKSGDLRLGAEVLSEALKMDATLHEAVTARQLAAERGNR